MTRVRTITVKDVEQIAFCLAQETPDWGEPIPEFSTRFADRLESSLVVPFQTFSKRKLYPTFLAQASALFYLMIKNHPFQNGNKRIAITTLLVFLARNRQWLEVSIQELYNFTVWVAESPASLKEETMKAVEKFLKLNIVPLDRV